MTIGVGVDILSIQRMADILSSSTGEGFKKKVFAEGEIRRAAQFPDPTVYFATRFAGKEAVFKTFGVSWAPEDAFTDVAIAGGPGMPPEAVVRGRLSRLLKARDANILLSLSHDTQYVIAFAVQKR